jgi:hypothetical protein
MNPRPGMSGEHTDVGAYSLGLLDQGGRRAFEDHLAGCAACAGELAQLSPVAELLTGIDPVGAADEQPAAIAVAELIRRRAARQRRRFRRLAAAAVVAGVVLLAAGITAGIAVAPRQGPAAAVTGALHSAADPGTGVSGTVSLVARPWGTELTLNLSNVYGPLMCDLVAVSRTGETQVAMTWLVPAAGYGVPGQPGHLIIEGGTAIQGKDLTRVDIDVVHGSTLLSIPV